MKLILFLFLIFNSLLFNGLSQKLIYQDNIKGGIVWDGVINYGTPLTRNLNLIPPQASTVEKIFALVLVQRSYYSDSGYCKINHEKKYFNKNNIISGYTLEVNNYDSLHNIHYFDLTNQIPIDSLPNLSIEYVFNSGTNVQSNATRGIILGVIFKNATYNPNLISIYVPTVNVSNNEIHKFKLSNPINSNKPVLLSSNVYISCPVSNGLGGHLILQNDTLGLFGDSDPIVAQQVVYGGTVGSFEFYNQLGYDKSGDIFDNIVDGHDAVLNLQNKPYISNSELQLKVRSRYFNGGSGHLPIAFLFAYTTTCEEFAVTTPEPQAVCKGDPLQLNVTGGNKYEWLPQRGLSCYDCPNPVVSTDSSRFYTVRVWNNDSCSVVRPVHVSVNELPKFNGLALTPTQCADSTGKIVAVKHPTVSGTPLWSINGGAFEAGTTTTKTYNNLPEGSYTITLKDENGCTRDTTVELTYTIMTQAVFSVNPNQGVAPLTVDITNSSTNYTNSAWYLQGNYEDSVLTQLTLDPSGLYTLELITWYKDPKCADTSSRTILVYDTLVVSTPNVFTPNADGVNDFFGVTSNQPATVKCTLFNRWGNEVHQNEVTSSTAGYIPLWGGENFDEGVYFFKISVQTDKMEAKEMNGFVHLEK